MLKIHNLSVKVFKNKLEDFIQSSKDKIKHLFKKRRDVTKFQNKNVVKYKFTQLPFQVTLPWEPEINK